VIVADANILIYLMAQLAQSDLALQAYQRDPDWVAPDIWRHEFANVLVTFVRTGALDLHRAIRLMEEAEEAMDRHTFSMDLRESMALANRLGLSAYDAQYVLLAQNLGVLCVTEDQRILARAKGTAVSLRQFCMA
jgi:predicted nucleic acid-binding protein